MAEKVDLSLDDIIKMNKKNASNQRGSRQNNKPNAQKLKKLGVRSGIIRKGGPKPVSNRQQQQTTPVKEPTMLHVSNLHYNVSNDDVKELFSEIGALKKAAVHYDKSGRSLGTAEVTFHTKDAALRAIKKYHNLPLDGRPMSITLVPSQTTMRSPAKSRIGVKPGSGIYKKPQVKRNGQITKPRSGSQQRGKPNGQRGNQRQPKKQLTAEQLDADLEEYNMNVD